jgi:type I restriction enzyme R subunit
MSNRGQRKSLYSVGQPERVAQARVVELFKGLGYRYLGNWEKRAKNSNVEIDILRAWLETRGYEKTLIEQAIDQFARVAGNQNKSLYDTNKAVYSLLRYGVKVKPGLNENTVTVWLIDWQEPRKNDFALAEEVTLKGGKTKRPDLVLYVNGIALGVLELKGSTNAVSEGIRQNLLNQRKEFIGQFFTTMQFVLAGNDTEGLRYGTIETPEEQYLTWKEDQKKSANGADPQSTDAQASASQDGSLLDRQLRQLCQPLRLLEIIHNFVVFDAGKKKLCRPNQYFGVRAAQKRVRSREGGIIWHTQGSGKSLTMVWLAKWIREHQADARVLIITDRTELDEQIEKVFKGVDEEIYRTRSGQDLITQLNATLPWLICSLIHKFPGQDEGDIDGFLAEVKRVLPPDFKAKGNIHVFIDECHRTQSGKLHEAMKQILPNALFIGFTGTPLLKADKQKSIEVFGSYIHTYKYDEAVRDQVVLDLRYEARDIDQRLTSPAKIDQWFAAKTQGLNDLALAQLKQKWGTMQKVLSSQSRLEQIVADIRLDMETQPRLKSGLGNAMLVSSSIYQACKLYELFVNSGFEKCAIVTSYKPSTGDIRTEAISEEGMTEKLKQYEIYNRMLNGQSVEDFEQEVKRKFIEEPAQMKLLIVVDKLLTGFDAPPATYLYIDKHMRDHGLFQAICRVNRLHSEDKDYGYIIDYKDLFKSLERSIHDYTSEVLDGYEQADVEGLLKDRLAKDREDLEQAREAIKALCEAVEAPGDTPAYIRYFCGDTSDKAALKEREPQRLLLYKLTAALLRAYADLANELPRAGYSSQEIAQIKREVNYYSDVRTEIKMASGDYIDLKMYEPAMRYLIDTYIRAEDSVKVSSFDNMPLVQLLVERGTGALDTLPAGIAGNKSAMAETIENNIRRLITDEMPVNPAYYARMSELLDTLILERKQQARDYEDYLATIIELARQVNNPETGSAYPPSLNTPARRALYDNLGQNEAQAIAIDQAIQRTRKDGWRGNMLKEREISYAIAEVVEDKARASEILEIAKQQSDY